MIKPSAVAFPSDAEDKREHRRLRCVLCMRVYTTLHVHPSGEVSFSVPDFTDAVIVSANVASPPVISDSKRYWFVLEATDPVKDSIFWARWERQPATTMAIRESKSWHIEEGAFGAMLRMYGR